MNKYLIFSVAVATLFTFKVEAVLPPLYQGIKEIQAILSSQEFQQKLDSGDVIEKIKRTENGFKIITNKRSLQVHVIYAQTGKIGPADFTLKFDDPTDVE